MYKTKFRDWNIEKKLKREDVINILRADELNRRSNNKRDFILRGFPVNMRTVRRCATRNGLTPAKWALPPNASWRMPEYLQCVILPQAQVSLQDAQQISEQFLFESKAYYEACLSNGTWRFTKGRGITIYSGYGDIQLQFRFQEVLRLARNILTTDRARAGALIRSGFLWLEDLIMSDHAELIETVVQEVLYFQGSALPWVASSLAAHAAHLSTHYLSTEHPKYRIFHILTRIVTQDVKSSLSALKSVSKKMLLQTVARATNSADSWIFERRLGLLCDQVVENPQLDIRKTLPDAATLQSVYGPQDHRCYRTLVAQAEAFRSRKDWQGLRDVGKALIRYSKFHPRDGHLSCSFVAGRGRYLVGQACFLLRKDDKAERYLLHAWKIASRNPRCSPEDWRSEQADICYMLLHITREDGRLNDAEYWRKEHYRVADEMILADRIDMQLDPASREVVLATADC